MTPEPKKPIDEIQKEFNEEMKKQKPRREPIDTSAYGKTSTEPGKPDADED